MILNFITIIFLKKIEIFSKNVPIFKKFGACGSKILGFFAMFSPQKLGFFSKSHSPLGRSLPLLHPWHVCIMAEKFTKLFPEFWWKSFFRKFFWGPKRVPENWVTENWATEDVAMKVGRRSIGQPEKGATRNWETCKFGDEKLGDMQIRRRKIGRYEIGWFEIRRY